MHRLVVSVILLLAIHSLGWWQDTAHIILQLADGVFPYGSFYKTTLTMIPRLEGVAAHCTIRFYGLQRCLGSERLDAFTVNIHAGGTYSIQKTYAESGDRYRIRYGGVRRRGVRPDPFQLLRRRTRTASSKVKPRLAERRKNCRPSPTPTRQPVHCLGLS